MQWAEQLGISQPTMARLERGDPAIATATYVMCLWLVNPQLNLLQLVASPSTPAPPASALGKAAAPAPPGTSGMSAAQEFADLLAQWTTSTPYPSPTNADNAQSTSDAKLSD